MKMRRPIAIEGKPTTDGRLIKNGALRWNDGPIPVVSEGFAGEIIGKAESIRRESDGTITADITPDIADDQAVTIFVVEAEYSTASGTLVISSGKIHGLTAVPKAMWTWPDEP